MACIDNLHIEMKRMVTLQVDEDGARKIRSEMAKIRKIERELEMEIERIHEPNAEDKIQEKETQDMKSIFGSMATTINSKNTSIASARMRKVEAPVVVGKRRPN